VVNVCACLNVSKTFGKQIFCVLLLVCMLCFTLADVAIAAVAPSQQAIETLHIHLGNEAGSLVFEPSTLTFKAGRRYKLFLLLLRLKKSGEFFKN